MTSGWGSEGARGEWEEGGGKSGSAVRKSNM